MAGLDFEMSLKQLEGKVLSAARLGMERAGALLLRDAVQDEPTVPILEGTLRGSGSSKTESNPDGTIKTVVGFNTPYAAYQHEGVRADGTHKVKKYSQPGAGRKFLEKKLYGNSKAYFREVARTIDQEAGV